MTPRPDILVAGAGPTGLALALQARAHGARVRVVERRSEAFRPSRALIMHPRTLEALRPLGVTDALLARADTGPRVALRLGSRVLDGSLAALALPDTAFPHLSLLRQTDVETVLARALAERGPAVEYGTELVAARDGPDAATVVLRSTHGAEDLRCAYVVGCDGPASTVRRDAGIGWRGGPYAEEVVLADVELKGSPGRLADAAAHVAVGRDGLVFLFPLGEAATWRLLATRPAEPGPLPFGQPGPAVPRAELDRILVAADLGVGISEVAWSARVPLQHRLATRFSQGRLFLAGDAAHAYSPATGQGMNTGIQDAVNLGWKLAFAAADGGGTGGALLDSYDRERRPAARGRLLLTHAAFWGEASTARIPAWMRGTLLPAAAPLLTRLLRRPRLVAGAVRTVSQLRVDYRRSPLSVEAGPRLPGRPRAGDRLPDGWVASRGRTVRLHGLTSAPGVHLLLLGDAYVPGSPPSGPWLTAHRLARTQPSGIVAVRPDGHVGFSGGDDPAALRAWLTLVRAPGR